MAKSNANEIIKARCLINFTHNETYYAVDDIFTSTQNEVDALAANGYIDPHQDAVSYIEGLK